MTIDEYIDYYKKNGYIDVEVCLQGIRDRVGKERRDIPWTDNKLDPELVKLVKNYETEDKPVLIELFNN